MSELDPHLAATWGELPEGTPRLKVIGFRLCYIEYVLELPQIDLTLKKPRFVFWCDAAMGQEQYGQDGTGDNQVWAWYPGASRYVPLEKFSYLSGVPKST